MGILYISYDGMLEPLGQSQVLAYQEKLSSTNKITVLSFEKRQDWQDKASLGRMRARMKAAGITWVPLTYHKRPTAPATAFDILAGTCVALWIVLRHRKKVVHVRSYVPATMGWIVTRLTGAKFLFDIRGFWADERVEGGIWPANSRLYRYAKYLERRFFLAADQVVTLTHASKREIEKFNYLRGRVPPVEVIPTCADLEMFKPLGLDCPAVFTLGYLGSVGSWYLFDEVVACFKILLEHEPLARLLIVNRGEHQSILESLQRGGVERARVSLESAEHRDVPKFIGRMSAAAAIIKPVYSKIASAPTKLAEYLGCGVPCLGNDRVGDMAEILEDNRVGVALTDFSDGDRRAAVTRLLELVREPQTRQRCVETARSLFSLDGGVALYRDIYNRLSSRLNPGSTDPGIPAAVSGTVKIAP